MASEAPPSQCHSAALVPAIVVNISRKLAASGRKQFQPERGTWFLIPSPPSGQDRQMCGILVGSIDRKTWGQAKKGRGSAAVLLSVRFWCNVTPDWKTLVYQLSMGSIQILIICNLNDLNGNPPIIETNKTGPARAFLIQSWHYQQIVHLSDMKQDRLKRTSHTNCAVSLRVHAFRSIACSTSTCLQFKHAHIVWREAMEKIYISRVKQILEVCRSG